MTNPGERITALETTVAAITKDIEGQKVAIHNLQISDARLKQTVLVLSALGGALAGGIALLLKAIH